MKRWGLAAVVLAVTPVALAVALAVHAGLFSTTGSIGSATTKTETFRWSRPPAPNLYVQFQGPSGVVSTVRRRFPGPASQMVAVHKPGGPEACSFSAGKVTIWLYGNKSFASGVCKLIHAALAKS